jgi:glycosyltransferase involved in cell wall biosynthesis
MRVLAVGNMYPPHDLGGGYEITWRSAMAHLRESGHEVRVLTTDFRAEGAGDEFHPDVHRTLRWYWHDHDFPRRSWRERIALERHNASELDRHLGDFRPDVMNWWAMGGMSLGLVERVARGGQRAVGVVGDEWLSWAPRTDAWQRPFRDRPHLAAAAERLTGLPARLDLSRAALWLFNSEATRSKTRTATGHAFERSGIAHPGIDDALFRAAPERREWRGRLLYLGRMDPRKGIHLAVEALAELPRAELALQGSGDEGYVAELHERAGTLGVADRVRFLSEPRERLPALYADADAVLFPVQWDEPWGLVPLEAMGVGRPVIATGTGGSGEYLRDGRNCLLFEPRDSAAALAAAVRRLADDGELRHRLRAGGLETASHYTEQAYNRAIKEALEGEAGAA